MKTKSEFTCLHKLLDEEIERFLCIEAELSAKLSQWLAVETYPPLALLLRDYQTLINTHINMLNRIVGTERLAAEDSYNNLSMVILADAEERMKLCKHQEVRDACLISAVQSMIHLKITGYGTAASFAAVLELDKIAADFHEMAEDEKFYDGQLTHLARQEVNKKALKPLSSVI